MSTDTTVVLPPNSGGPSLDAEQYTQKSSTVVDRERIASVAGTPTAAQTTMTNSTPAGAGNNVVVAAVGGQTIRLMRMILVASAPVSVEITDTGSVVMGPFPLQTGGSIVLDDSGEPWWVGASGNPLDINLSAAVSVQVTVWTTQS
jgi:hypothetical protein